MGQAVSGSGFWKKRAFCLAMAAAFSASGMSSSHAVRSGDVVQTGKKADQIKPHSRSDDVGFVEMDLNFDGVKDLAIVKSDSLSPRPKIIYFLYDPNTKAYERSSALGALAAPEFDPHAKQVKSVWREHNLRKVSEVYAWHSDTLQLLERREWDLTTNTCLAVRYTWENQIRRNVAKSAC